MTTTGWGFYEQGSDQLQEVEELGSRLSKEIGCGVHYPAFGKRLFECRCGVVFPIYFLRGSSWDKAREKHNLEKELIYD